MTTRQPRCARCGSTEASDLCSGGQRRRCIAATVADMLGGGRTVAPPGGLRGRLAVQSEVEPGRLGVIGSCTGGGFAVAAATRSDFAVATDARARVLAFLADRLQGPAGGEPTGGGG